MRRGDPHFHDIPWDHPARCQHEGHVWHHSLTWRYIRPSFQAFGFISGAPSVSTAFKQEIYAVDCCARDCGQWRVVDYERKVLEEGGRHEQPSEKYRG